MGFITASFWGYLVICGMGSVKQLLVYQKAYSQAMDVFQMSKKFPKEERYSLTDQIRKSSRAVCANLAEAYRKRIYPAHFVSKVSDAVSENAETSVWLDFSRDCAYIPGEKHHSMIADNNEIGRLIVDILKNPSKYL